MRTLILALTILLLTTTAAEAPEPMDTIEHVEQAGTGSLGAQGLGECSEFKSSYTAEQTLLFEATGYSHSCGNGDGKTATGTIPRPGVISVDPKVIPLGTQLHIEGYGYGVAEDTGGLIKGHKLDLFFETEDEAWIWGRRMVEVRIVE
ncbi:MAG: 3D domain-containing protein [Candidatus Desulforudaceae bacterium]